MEYNRWLTKKKELMRLQRMESIFSSCSVGEVKNFMVKLHLVHVTTRIRRHADLRDGIK